MVRFAPRKEGQVLRSDKDEERVGKREARIKQKVEGDYKEKGH